MCKKFTKYLLWLWWWYGSNFYAYNMYDKICWVAGYRFRYAEIDRFLEWLHSVYHPIKDNWHLSLLCWTECGFQTTTINGVLCWWCFTQKLSRNGQSRTSSMLSAQNVAKTLSFYRKAVSSYVSSTKQYNLLVRYWKVKYNMVEQC